MITWHCREIDTYFMNNWLLVSVDLWDKKVLFTFNYHFKGAKLIMRLAIALFIEVAGLGKAVVGQTP